MDYWTQIDGGLICEMNSTFYIYFLSESPLNLFHSFPRAGLFEHFALVPPEVLYSSARQQSAWTLDSQPQVNKPGQIGVLDFAIFISFFSAVLHLSWCKSSGAIGKKAFISLIEIP